MPCHAMPCHAMPCHAMPCHAMPCHAMPCHAMPCHAMPYHTIPYHTRFEFCLVLIVFNKLKCLLTVIEKDPENEEGKNILERVNTILNIKNDKKGRKPRNKKKVRYITDVFNTKSDIFKGKTNHNQYFSRDASCNPFLFWPNVAKETKRFRPLRTL